MLSLWFW